ncbi:hypothetical protein RIF29_21406 [Crotalaria pallida]|uniref:Uncharacterized protein n=1 Tax=Crotalaria pallida TaxID=3830 RepID=A0AAN9F591_CROPI
MAKGIRNLSSWMEVAPAPIILPKKPSNSPGLETIIEEAADDYIDNKLYINRLLNQLANVARSNADNYFAAYLPDEVPTEANANATSNKTKATTNADDDPENNVGGVGLDMEGPVKRRGRPKKNTTSSITNKSSHIQIRLQIYEGGI